MGYKICFDRYAVVNVISGAGTPSLSGTFGTQLMLNSSTAQDLTLSGTTVVCGTTIAYTLYDSTAHSNWDGFFKLEIESTD